MTKPDTRVLLR